jgi:hypothetical protein
MYPEILRELGSQHSREMRDQAHQAMLARTARKARRASRRGLSGPDDGDGFVAPAIPDYVDGSFRVTPIDEAGSQPDQVSTTGHAV